jgi:hypothetical protein
MARTLGFCAALYAVNPYRSCSAHMLTRSIRIWSFAVRAPVSMPGSSSSSATTFFWSKNGNAFSTGPRRVSCT